MKVKVIRDLPFAKVGKILKIEDGIEFKGFRMGYTSEFIPINILIDKGWLEEVKEETLEESLRKYPCGRCILNSPRNISQLAKDRAKEVITNCTDLNLDDEIRVLNAIDNM